MERTKLTVRVPRDLLEGAKRYASENDMTLTQLISEFLRQLTTQSDPLTNAPIVQRLSGTLSRDVSVEDYRKYLENMAGKISALIDLNIILDTLHKREPFYAN